MGERRESEGDLLQGTLDMLILKTLSRRAMHGYAIAEFSPAGLNLDEVRHACDLTPHKP